MEELDLVAVLVRGKSILDTSSALMVLRPGPLVVPLEPLHPDLSMDWTFKGGATAVICDRMEQSRGYFSCV